MALPTPSGNVVPGMQYGASGTLSLTTGSYDCSGGGGQRMASQNNYNEGNNNPSTAYRGNNATFDATQYVNETTLYRYINEYPSAKDNNIAYTNFYNSKLNTSIDQFMRVEKTLYDQQPAQAIGIVNSVVISNNVETNYRNFYAIYAKWQTGIFTSADSILLVKLVNLCPGLDGEVIYQARALYNAIYKTVVAFNENCDPLAQENLRSAYINKINVENDWTIELYPNPANTFVNIVSNKEKDQLKVVVADVNGKILFVKQVITSNFICNLELDLLPGAYFVTITNDKNNSTNKKLIIAK
ncbi:MAG: T9SS type A sorting domain-containing protein [Bacteroidia bacterium]|nr:T9SS type A sorting domain-containing protein [Bacteroidia bacterium]